MRKWFWVSEWSRDFIGSLTYAEVRCPFEKIDHGQGKTDGNRKSYTINIRILCSKDRTHPRACVFTSYEYSQYSQYIGIDPYAPALLHGRAPSSFLPFFLPSIPWQFIGPLHVTFYYSLLSFCFSIWPFATSIVGEDQFLYQLYSGILRKIYEKNIKLKKCLLMSRW